MNRNLHRAHRGLDGFSAVAFPIGMAGRKNQTSDKERNKNDYSAVFYSEHEMSFLWNVNIGKIF